MNPSLFFAVVLTIVSLIFVESRKFQAGPSNSPLRKRYDGYGEDWMFMPDGNGKPQVAILKGHPGPEGRNVFDDQAISYILYTKTGPSNGTSLSVNDTNTLKDFLPSRKTKFITHGWKSSSSSSGFIDMKTAYLNHGDYNVILVDWEPLASSAFYLGPMKNTRRVGSEAAKFIDYLVEQTGLRTDDVHFIGHSLGAHVAGNTGSSVKSGKLNRITGLDPALPGFHLFATTDGRLDSTDADFVDVVHSCGGILGWLQPLGDADFYPNGGVAVQPGCCCLPELMEACSHGRSYVYFTESINSPTGLNSTQCDTWDNYNNGKCSKGMMVSMGEHVDRSARGSYYLKTKSQKPYAYEDDKFLFFDDDDDDNEIDDCDETNGKVKVTDGNGKPICRAKSI